ncbi:NADP-dependent oxidoreductase [Streptomyces sp. NPDC089919]|uniref:NADP-dependent oxidoreductase n=1 Tax=Streptomyces sp. NPDC089919 TaxID=3155188 RepID=UPI00343E40E6
MRAAIAESYGNIEDVVRVSVVDEPVIGPTDLYVEMRAASVNPIDWLIVTGRVRILSETAFPLRLGSDGAGVVRAVGSEVADFEVGDEVYFRVAPDRPGTFAEFVAVDAALAARKPASATFVDAAGIPLVALTAWQGLVEQAGASAGQRLLVHGGAGAVGAAVVQLARDLGLHVTATASAQDTAWVGSLGADRVLDYRTQAFDAGPDSYDIVFDTVGGETQTRSYAVLAHGGTLVSTVAAPAADVHAHLYGVQVKPFLMRPDGDQLARIADLFDAGALRSRIDSVFSLADVGEALGRSASGHAKGKVVVVVAT